MHNLRPMKDPKGKEINKAIKNVIVMQKGKRMECWGSIAEIARIHKFSYHILIRKEFPFEYEKWEFRSIPFREASVLSSKKK